MGKLGKKSGIYGIYCKGSGKWYVGASKDITRRLKDHMRECKTDAKLSKSYSNWDFRYHGDMGRDYAQHGRLSFSLHWLEEIKDPSSFSRREKYWIDAKNSRGAGYNKEATGKEHHTWRQADGVKILD